MKVFISYSIDDTDLLHQIIEAIRVCGDEVRCWDKSREPGREVWPSIFEWIDECDIVIAIITDKTAKRGISVGNEIGHAIAKGKPILPLVGPDVNPGELGCLTNVVFQRIERGNAGPAILAVQRTLASYKERAFMEKLALFGAIAGGIALAFAVQEPVSQQRPKRQPTT